LCEKTWAGRGDAAVAVVDSGGTHHRTTDAQPHARAPEDVAVRLNRHHLSVLRCLCKVVTQRVVNIEVWAPNPRYCLVRAALRTAGVVDAEARIVPIQPEVATASGRADAG
jgi:hypothetical protein